LSWKNDYFGQSDAPLVILTDRNADNAIDEKDPIPPLPQITFQDDLK